MKQYTSDYLVVGSEYTIRLNLPQNERKNSHSNANGKQYMFTVYQVHIFCFLSLCSKHNAREKKHVWNSLFSWSFNLKRFRWLFLSFVRFSFPFISAVPFDLNEFFQDILHWIGMVWIIRFPISFSLSASFSCWISSEFIWCQEMIERPSL